MNSTDEDLVRECLEGDTGAYGELVRRHQARVYGIAYRALRDEALAEDLAQEVFIRAYRSLHRFQEGRRFGPWLMAITSNRIRDHLKARTRRGEVTWVMDRHEPAKTSTPLERAAARRTLARVEHAVSEMPDETREVLRLRFHLGFDYDDISEALGVPLGTVKSRISRARALLKEQLGE